MACGISCRMETRGCTQYHHYSHVWFKVRLVAKIQSCLTSKPPVPSRPTHRPSLYFSTQAHPLMLSALIKRQLPSNASLGLIILGRLSLSVSRSRVRSLSAALHGARLSSQVLLLRVAHERMCRSICLLCCRCVLCVARQVGGGRGRRIGAEVGVPERLCWQKREHMRVKRKRRET